ncbi:hypothetical protein Tco_1517611 [Tanacetum coccineum]
MIQQLDLCFLLEDELGAEAFELRRASLALILLYMASKSLGCHRKSPGLLHVGLNTSDVFDRYSQLCTRNVFPCCSSSSSTFQRYSNLCVMDINVLCQPTSSNVEVSNSVTNVQRVFEGSPDTAVLLNENNITRIPRSVGREITLDFEQSVVRCDNVIRMPGSIGKEIILDFEQLAVSMVPSEWDSRRVRSKPRHYRDDRYGCLLQQLGSVEMQGQSSGASGQPFGVASTGSGDVGGSGLTYKNDHLDNVFMTRTLKQFDVEWHS